MEYAMIVKFILFLLILVLPISAVAATFNDHVNRHYKDLVRKLEDQHFRGPIANDLIKYALVRQIHENGPDRPFDYSIPGIGLGGWNKEILFKVIHKLNPNVKVKVIRDAEGMAMYELKGDQACHITTITIARLYDYYIYKFNFSAADRNVWEKSKAYSFLIACNPTNLEFQRKYKELAPAREKILKRCNRMFGPGGDRIEGEVKKLFKETK
jgi:hypothetical protein